jgi:DnaJ-domain-containing protein 1
MDGEILEGRFAGRRLSDLSLDDLVGLHGECRADEESTTLLDAYLDRVYGEDWYTRAQASDETRSYQTGAGIMSREEAYEILGLKPGANRDEVIEAHRRLMQKLHPDRGGSTYLAAKINRAKDVLLED